MGEGGNVTFKICGVSGVGSRM